MELIDRYGEALVYDMHVLGVNLMDVIRGDGPHPHYVLALIAGLPDTSETVAMASGGREHRGWGADRYMFAELYDAVNLLTRVTVGSKCPKIPPFPRPNSTVVAKETEPAEGGLHQLRGSFLKLMTR